MQQSLATILQDIVDNDNTLDDLAVMRQLTQAAYQYNLGEMEQHYMEQVQMYIEPRNQRSLSIVPNVFPVWK